MNNNFSIGQTLIKAREDKKLDLKQVSEKLNIRKSYLEALETGDYDILPGKAYISGFIKSYAEYLGLNPDELLKMLKATQNLQENYENMPKQLYKDYKRTKRIFALSFMALILVITAFSYYGYVNHQIKIRQIDKKASSSETLASFFNNIQKNKNEDNINKTDSQEDYDNIVDTENVELDGQKGKIPFARVLFKANEDVWIRVRSIQRNKTYVSKTISAGKYYWLAPWENVVLDTSNPAYLEIIIDGKNMGSLGSNSKKIRGLFLDVESLNTYFEHKEYLNNDPIENYYQKSIDVQS